MSRFAENLKRALDNRMVSQKRLAEKTGLTETTISRYVNGEREPNTKNLKLIAEALNVSIDWLCEYKYKKAQIGDVVIVRGPHKPYLGIVVEDREYQPVIFVRNIGLLGNELGVNYSSWSYLDIIGHIDLNDLYGKALAIQINSEVALR